MNGPLCRLTSGHCGVADRGHSRMDGIDIFTGELPSRRLWAQAVLPILPLDTGALVRLYFAEQASRLRLSGERRQILCSAEDAPAKGENMLSDEHQ